MEKKFSPAEVAANFNGEILAPETKIPGTLLNPEISSFEEGESFKLSIKKAQKIGLTKIATQADVNAALAIDKNSTMKVGDRIPLIRQDGQRAVATMFDCDGRWLALGSLLRTDATGKRCCIIPAEILSADPNEVFKNLDGYTVTCKGKKNFNMRDFGGKTSSPKEITVWEISK